MDMVAMIRKILRAILKVKEMKREILSRWFLMVATVIPCVREVWLMEESGWWLLLLAQVPFVCKFIPSFIMFSLLQLISCLGDFEMGFIWKSWLISKFTYLLGTMNTYSWMVKLYPKKKWKITHTNLTCISSVHVRHQCILVHTPS